MIWNATNSCKFHVINSEIICIYIYIMIVKDTKIILEMQPNHTNFMSLVLKLYIYVCVCSHLISPCCSPCWWVFLRFSISSPGDFISFPHLFDHFIKRIWSVIQIYLISLSQKTCFPPISSFCCLVHQLSQVFPIYFSSWSLQFVFSSPKFSQPIGACYHWVSSVFPTYFLC